MNQDGGRDTDGRHLPNAGPPAGPLIGLLRLVSIWFAYPIVVATR